MGNYIDEQFHRCLRYIDALFSHRDVGYPPRLPTREALAEVAEGVKRMQEKSIDGDELERRAAENLEWAYVSARGDHAAMLATDAMLTFFHHCYALKDWIKNDPDAGVLAQHVEAVVSGSPELCACADIANGSKHLNLTRRRSGQVQTVILHAFRGVDPISVPYMYVGEPGGNQQDAYELANACMARWATFLGKPWEPRGQRE